MRKTNMIFLGISGENQNRTKILWITLGKYPQSYAQKSKNYPQEQGSKIQTKRTGTVGRGAYIRLKELSTRREIV